MKKALIVLMIFTVVLSNMPTANAATDPYNHAELMEYEGYGKVMYETLVEETMFLTGHYANNRDYVRDSITEIQNYASYVWDEMERIGEANSFKELVSGTGGLFLTAGDWFKKTFFGGYKEEYKPPVQAYYDFASYVDVVGVSKENVDDGIFNSDVYIILDLDVKKPFSLTYKMNSLNKTEVFSGKMSLKLNMQGWYYNTGKGSTIGYVMFRGFGQNLFNEPYWYQTGKVYPIPYEDGVSLKTIIQDSRFYASSTIYSDYLNNMSNSNYIFNNLILNKANSVGNNMSPNFNITTDKTVLDDFEEIINNNIDKVVMPQPKAYLSCPNGTKMQLAINGSTFLNADGQALIVAKDGTATIDSQICNLGWEKPVVKYINDKPAVETPDGNFKDIENGSVIKDDGSGEDGEDTGEGCSTVLCFLGSITKAIVGLVGKLLDGLLGLFVPDNLDFMRAEFDKMQGSLNSKFGVLDSVKGTITGGFAESDNKLDEIVLDLPILNEPVRFDTSFIESHIATLKRVMSGFMVLLTMLYLYRKITGRGGVMEK